MRGLIRAAITLGVVGFVGIAIVTNWPIAKPVKLGMIVGDAYRGAYLARSAGCVACHTNVANGGGAFAGGAPLDTPFGSFVPPNITTDLKAGIGKWTLDQFAVALRQGVRPDGKAYYPAFPYEFYAAFSDQDVADLWTALQIVPPNPVSAEKSHVRFPFNMRWGLKLWRAAFMTPSTFSPVIGKSSSWNRGFQLVTGATHCAACHTGRNLLGGMKSSEVLAGNSKLPGGSIAPAILSSVLVAKGWTVASLAYALRTGITPNGDVLGGSMSEVVRSGTSFLSETDREAIATYLLNLAPGDILEAPSTGDVDMADMVHTPGMKMDAN